MGAFNPLCHLNDRDREMEWCSSTSNNMWGRVKEKKKGIKKKKIWTLDTMLLCKIRYLIPPFQRKLSKLFFWRCVFTTTKKWNLFNVDRVGRCQRQLDQSLWVHWEQWWELLLLGSLFSPPPFLFVQLWHFQDDGTLPNVHLNNKSPRPKVLNKHFIFLFFLFFPPSFLFFRIIFSLSTSILIRFRRSDLHALQF